MVTRDIEFVLQYMDNYPTSKVSCYERGSYFLKHFSGSMVFEHRMEDNVQVGSMNDNRFLEVCRDLEFVFHCKVNKLTKLPDGSFKYDFERYSDYWNALIGEWEETDPDLKKETLEKLMEICWDKTAFPTVSLSLRQSWSKFVDYIYDLALKDIKKNKSCICERVLEKASESRDDGFEVSEEISTYNGLVMSMNAFKERNGSLSWYTKTVKQTDNKEEVISNPIMWCPYCGKKLKREWKL